MSDIQLSNGESPFDAIRRVRPDGSEYWTARDLQAVTEYARWEDFAKIIDRAIASARNSGENVAQSFSAITEKPLGGGRPRVDFELSRFGAYLTVMNGDPNMPRVAEAQSYFAVQTRMAETQPAELTEDQIVHRALHILDGKVKVLTTQVAELTAPARSWQLLADANGDFSVAEAAKILSRDPSITTGRDRLFDYMADQKWIFRSKNTRGGWEAYQTAVNTGRLVEKPARPFLNSKTGAYELPAPTIRVTAKGIGKLHELMGGTEPIRFVVGEAS